MDDKKKTKAQLIAELTELRKRNAELVVLDTECKQEKEEKVRLLHDLGERVKELNCLYSLSKLVEQEPITLEEIFMEIVNIIPASWQYPDITCSRIVFEGHTYKTANFKKTKWKQSAKIKVHAVIVGEIEIFYLEKKPELDEGPFLKEEKNLIDAIAEQLERIIERSQAEEAFREENELNLALFEHNPIETIAVDIEGRITNFNLAKKKSSDRLPAIGDVMYRDYAGRHEIDMYTELLECIRTGKPKEFPEKKYGDRFLTINISPYPHGAVITSQDITERKEVAESLKASQSELQKQKLALEQKTIALKEVIGEIEEEKNIIRDDITTHVNEVLLPILERLKLKETSNKYIDLLRHHLEKLISSFGRKITTKSVNLTPREIQICTMVESGLTNKEISMLLSISCHTVEKHRNNIRNKFGITNKNINLSSFLQQL